MWKYYFNTKGMIQINTHSTICCTKIDEITIWHSRKHTCTHFRTQNAQWILHILNNFTITQPGIMHNCIQYHHYKLRPQINLQIGSPCHHWPVSDLWSSRITHSAWAENVVYYAVEYILKFPKEKHQFLSDLASSVQVPTWSVSDQ